MKTYIITGANSGLGFETAKRIAKKGYRVILACRNMEKGSEAADAIKSETGNENIESRQLDLASLVSVRKNEEMLRFGGHRYKEVYEPYIAGSET